MAVIVSPVMAGQLADLAGRFPQKFGHVGFLKRYPFAPPVLLDGLILFIALLMVFFFLEEVSNQRQMQPCVADEFRPRPLNQYAVAMI